MTSCPEQVRGRVEPPSRVEHAAREEGRSPPAPFALSRRERRPRSRSSRPCRSCTVADRRACARRPRRPRSRRATSAGGSRRAPRRSSPRRIAKTSTVRTLFRRKSCGSASASAASPRIAGSAVFAAGKRWSWTRRRGCRTPPESIGGQVAVAARLRLRRVVERADRAAGDARVVPAVVVVLPAHPAVAVERAGSARPCGTSSRTRACA